MLPVRRRRLLRLRDRPHQVGVGGAAGEDLPAVLQVRLMEFPLEEGQIRRCPTLSPQGPAKNTPLLFSPFVSLWQLTREQKGLPEDHPLHPEGEAPPAAPQNGEFTPQPAVRALRRQAPVRPEGSPSCHK